MSERGGMPGEPALRTRLANVAIPLTIEEVQ
jgi:hypothetical protein